MTDASILFIIAEFTIHDKFSNLGKKIDRLQILWGYTAPQSQSLQFLLPCVRSGPRPALLLNLLGFFVDVLNVSVEPLTINAQGPRSSAKTFVQNLVPTNSYKRT